tara:strand:- start:291 stop:608 length:318 start_codon:yes stop_codon:yes gene_type:complete
MISRNKKLIKAQQHNTMTLDQEQKKLLLDVFNAGREFSEDYKESGIKYMRVWTIEQLNDLIDDMRDAFGIVPTISTNKDNDGKYYPNHWSDHVWSDDHRAYKSKD